MAASEAVKERTGVLYAHSSLLYSCAASYPIQLRGRAIERKQQRAESMSPWKCSEQLLPLQYYKLQHH